MSPGPLSILHVDLSKHFGGAERYCLDLASRQIDQGHKVGLVILHACSGRGAINHHAPSALAIYEAPWIFASRTVARAIAAQGADIINVHLPDSARAVAVLRKRPPMVMTLHIRYRQKEMRGVAGLIRIADWQEEEARGFAGPAITAHNWPPAERPFDPARVTDARKEIGAGEGVFVVGAIMRLNRIKRLDLLIDAWRRAGLRNARLAIIGDGPERAALLARADGDASIRFLGHHDDVENWHRALDLFVLPSDWEGMPLGVLEAMRAGTPIIATASVGTAEVLQDTSAVLVPCGDAEALAEALTQAQAQFNAGGLRRQTYDLARFDPQRALARIETFYRQIIAQRDGA